MSSFLTSFSFLLELVLASTAWYRATTVRVAPNGLPRAIWFVLLVLFAAPLGSGVAELVASSWGEKLALAAFSWHEHPHKALVAIASCAAVGIAFAVGVSEIADRAGEALQRLYHSRHRNRRKRRRPALFRALWRTAHAETVGEVNLSQMPPAPSEPKG